LYVRQVAGNATFETVVGIGCSKAPTMLRSLEHLSRRLLAYITPEAEAKEKEKDSMYCILTKNSSNEL